MPPLRSRNNTGPAFEGDTLIDETNNPKGVAFADWMFAID